MLMIMLVVIPLLPFNRPAPTHIYPLSLHDALPICKASATSCSPTPRTLTARGSSSARCRPGRRKRFADRKSTRLNSSHVAISYAVFRLKKKHYPHDCALQDHPHDNL